MVCSLSLCDARVLTKVSQPRPNLKRLGDEPVPVNEKSTMTESSMVTSWTMGVAVALIEASKTTLRGSSAALHVSQLHLSLSDDRGEENLEA